MWQPDWPVLLADLQAALPQYSMRIVSSRERRRGLLLEAS